MMNKMQIVHKYNLLDFLIVLLNVTYGVSLIQVYTLDLFGINSKFSLLAFTAVAYLFRFGSSFCLLRELKSKVLILFLAIYFIDIFQNLLFVRISLEYVYLAVNTYFFLEYLYAIYKESAESNSVEKIIFPYKIFSIYNICVILLCTILILIGLLSPTDNQLATNSLTWDNTSGEHVYYFPGHLSLALDASRLFSEFNLPVLTGLSHEPHTLCFLILPFFFYQLSHIKSNMNKIILYLVCVIIMLVSTSTTAVMSFAIVFLFDIIWSLLMSKNKSYLLIVFVVIAILSKYGGGIYGLVQSEIFLKTTDETGSLDYSMAMLQYIISPHGIIGNGNITNEVGFKILSNDIGLVTCILDMILYGCLMWKSIQLAINKTTRYHYFGLACLYFLLHGLKMSIMLFKMPYFAFFIMIIVLMSREQSIERMEYDTLS